MDDISQHSWLYLTCSTSALAFVSRNNEKFGKSESNEWIRVFKQVYYKLSFTNDVFVRRRTDYNGTVCRISQGHTYRDINDLIRMCRWHEYANV